jgi:hypothetical protein
VRLHVRGRAKKAARVESYSPHVQTVQNSADCTKQTVNVIQQSYNYSQRREKVAHAGHTGKLHMQILWANCKVIQVTLVVQL